MNKKMLKLQIEERIKKSEQGIIQDIVLQIGNQEYRFYSPCEGTVEVETLFPLKSGIQKKIERVYKPSKFDSIPSALSPVSELPFYRELSKWRAERDILCPVLP